MYKKQFSWLSLWLMLSCMPVPQREYKPDSPVLPGAAQLPAYLPLLQGKKVALVVNPTSCVGARHLVDVLLGKGVAVKKVFAPEHGFRGDSRAGKFIADAMDPATGVPTISLYSTVREPTQATRKKYLLYDQLLGAHPGDQYLKIGECILLVLSVPGCEPISR